MSEIDEFEARRKKEEESQFLERKQSDSDATSVAPKGKEAGWAEMLMPKTTQMADNRTSSFYGMPNTFDFITSPIMDIMGLGTRTFASATGQGEMTDPDANIWGDARQRLRDYVDRGMKTSEQEQQEAKQKYANGHWTDALPKNDPYKYILDPRTSTVNTPMLKTLRGAAEMAFEIGGDPFAAGGFIKAISKRLGKSALRGVPKEKLTEGGFKLSPAQATEPGKQQALREAKEIAIQANPHLQKLPAEMAQKNLETVTGKVSGSSKGLDGKDVAGVRHGESRGELIEKAGEKVQEIGGKLYRKGEEIVTKPLTETKLPGTTKQVKTQVKSNLVDEAGNPIMNEKIVEKFTSNASKSVDKLLKEVGYKGGKITETAKVGSETISAALQYKKMIAEANTMGELINVKRNIDDKIFQGVKEGIFVGDKNKSFLRRINPSLNESIEEAIKKQLPKEYRDQYAKAYRAINKQISKTMDIMKEPSKTLKLGKSGFNSDKVLNSIQSIPPKSLLELKASATTRPLYEELRRGAFESMVLKSSPKDGFSPEKFRTAWANMGPDFKKAIFPEEMIKDMDKYLTSWSKTTGGNLKLANPSGTAKAKAIIEDSKGVLSGGKSLLKGLLTYHAVKHYYSSGKNIRESAINLAAKTGRGIDNITPEMITDIAKASTFADFFKPSMREE